MTTKRKRKSGAGRKSKGGKMVSCRLSARAIRDLATMAKRTGLNKTAALEMALEITSGITSTEVELVSHCEVLKVKFSGTVWGNPRILKAIGKMQQPEYTPLVSQFNGWGFSINLLGKKATTRQPPAG